MPASRTNDRLRATTLPAALVLSLAAMAMGVAGAAEVDTPTRAIERRLLQTTRSEPGVLERTGTHTIAYAGAMASNNGAMGIPTDNTDTAVADAQSSLTIDRDAPTPTTTSPSSSTWPPSSECPLPTSSTTPPSTTPPTSTTISGPPNTTTSTSGSTSTVTAPATTTTDTIPTSTTTTTTISTTVPGPPSTTTWTMPAPTTTHPPPTPPTTGSPGTAPCTSTSAPAFTTTPNPTVAANANPPEDDTGNAVNGSNDEPIADDPEALTAIAPVTTPVGRGTELYTADDEPTVSLIGPIPLWRDLDTGVEDGADVAQLEENLTELGYGEDLTVDEHFNTATAAAVEAWEDSLGRTAPDGRVEVGDIAYIAATGVVLAHRASVGDDLTPGAPILVVGTTQQVIVADVAVDKAEPWVTGTKATLEWADGTVTNGVVFGTGRDVTEGVVDLLVLIDNTDATRVSGSEVTITIVDASRPDALAVPVAAVHDGPNGTPAVQIVEPSKGGDTPRAVELGLIAAGWVEVTSGVEAGEVVRLPG